LHWIAGPPTQPAVDWAEEATPIAHPGGEFIDLRSESGLRVWVRTGDNRSRVLFQFHHACCDGLAGLMVVQDFLSCYKQAAGETGVELRLLDPAELKRRDQLASAADAKPTLGVALRDSWVTLQVWRRILFKNPTVLAAPAKASGETARREFLGFSTETLTVQETQQLNTLAASLGSTTNDVLIRDLFVTLREWNRRHVGQAGDRLRITIPVNVRRRDEAKMPAANRIGYGFVTGLLDGQASPQDRLAEVQLEMKQIKEWKLGLYFLGGLALGRGVPGVMPWMLRRERSFATAVLSNVGRFVADPANRRRDARWTCGPLVLNRVIGVPPVRRLTRAAIIALEYAGELTLALRCDPQLFDDAQTRVLLELFVAQVRGTIASGL